MGRIFISVGEGSPDEVQQLILLRALVTAELRSRGFEVLDVPAYLGLRETIQWINVRARRGDVAVQLDTNASPNPSARGASAFYIAYNMERQIQAQRLLRLLVGRLPQLPNRGAKPDTATGFAGLAFNRDVIIPSLLVEVGFWTNPSDRFLIQNRRSDLALGLTDGIAAFSLAVSGYPVEDDTPSVYPPPRINVMINNRFYPGEGILVNNKSYIPANLANQLGTDLITAPNVRRIQYEGEVYVRATDLQNYNIAVTWDNPKQTVILRAIA